MTKKNIITALVTITAVMVFAGVLFESYYEFNDDVLMKDILSGAYTGSPEALNIQMLSPMGYILAAFYRITAAVPWYGLFLLLCQYMSLFFVIVRAVQMTDSAPGRIVMGIVSFLVCTGLLLPHLVFIQYTITVAMMAASACFLIYTTPVGLSPKAFFIKMIVPALLIVAGFNLRSEMMLLCAPFLFISAVALLHRELSAKAHTSGMVAKYACTAGVILAFLLISFTIDKISYSSPEWKEFRSEFDSRTSLYDYQYVPDYEEGRPFYDGEGISDVRVNLLQIYDYGIDSRIDGPMMQKISDYAAAARKEATAKRIKDSIGEYIYRCSHFKDGVYSLVVLFMYLMAALAIMHNADGRVNDLLGGGMPDIGKAVRSDFPNNSSKGLRTRISILILRICGLFLMRSICWMYIIYGRRQPERITHSLYTVEIVILLAMVLTEYSGTLREKRYLKMVTAIVLIVAGLFMLPVNIRNINDRTAAQEKLNAYAKDIEDYCRSHPENFYWEDVYSTIIEGETFNEKIFSDTEFKNYDLIGGWCMNSPLLRKKIARFGINDISDDLISSDKTFIIVADTYDTGWIIDHYKETGVTAEVVRVDSIAGRYGVYEVN